MWPYWDVPSSLSSISIASSGASPAKAGHRGMDGYSGIVLVKKSQRRRRDGPSSERDREWWEFTVLNELFRGCAE